MLDQGLTVLRIRGIPVRLHLSLLVFLPYIAFVATRQYRFLARELGVPPDDLHMPPAFWGILLAIGLFVAVLVHELAHSLVALHYGAKVRSITLMMLGGVSVIEDDLPPLKEAWMAFVGPLASFAIAALSYVVYRFAPVPIDVLVAAFCFAVTNAFLGGFNLLPAFPMDGGRVVRGLLAGRLGRERATAVAARLGQAMAVLFVVWALATFNILLALIGWFIWAGASAEKQRLSVLHALRGLSVTDFMSDRLGEAWSDEHVGEVLRRLARGGLAGARVLDRADATHAHVAGVVTAESLEGVAERAGAEAPVTAAMDDAPRAVHAADDASEALGALSRGEGHAVVVLDADDHMIGLVTPAEIRRAVVLGRLRNGGQGA